MSVVQSVRERVLARSDLRVVREGVRFRNVSPGRVRIEIEVENRGSRASEPTTVALESAPLGAFLPWTPLERLSIGPIPAGTARVATLEVERTAVAPLGDFVRVPPSVLVAAAAPSEEPRDGRDTSLLPPRVLRRRKLAPDLFELLGRKNLHWAGNLNVFVGGRSVERHMAQALRVRPGSLNLALFMVGSSGRDAYAFDLEGSAVAWNAALYVGVPPIRLLSRAGAPERITRGAWMETRGVLPVTLLLLPPSRCEEGQVNVHVRQRSSGKEAVVEFGFDPRAAGPGCYVV